MTKVIWYGNGTKTIVAVPRKINRNGIRTSGYRGYWWYSDSKEENIATYCCHAHLSPEAAKACGRSQAARLNRSGPDASPKPQRGSGKSTAPSRQIPEGEAMPDSQEPKVSRRVIANYDLRKHLVMVHGVASDLVAHSKDALLKDGHDYEHRALETDHAHPPSSNPRRRSR